MNILFLKRKETIIKTMKFRKPIMTESTLEICYHLCELGYYLDAETKRSDFVRSITIGTYDLKI